MVVLGSLLKVFLVISLVTLCRAAIMIARATVHPHHPSSCWNSRLNQSIPVGGTWPEAPCQQGTCIRFREGLFVQMATCGQVAVPPGCSTVRDMSQDYPKCCPWAYCPEVVTEDLLGPEYEEFREWMNTYYDGSSSDYV